MSAAWEVFYKQMITLGGYKKVLEGLGNTALIAIFGLLIGMIIGCLLATCKILPKRSFIVKLLSGFSNFYIAIFRGTPMVVQLLLMHFVLFPLMGVEMHTTLEAILAFGLNSGAYVAEIMRGGILSVDIGQTEAGRALGLNYGQTMVRIVLPQAIKNVVPTLGNEFIALLKETSVAFYIGVADLTLGGLKIRSITYSNFMPLIAIAVIYLILVLGLSYLVSLLERRLRKSEK
ncbi:MAG: amino acid ABC transporter permease [Clostridia bacterium]|nr:amino acid ABC transporter permease [Clostridia bacterium]